MFVSSRWCLAQVVQRGGSGQQVVSVLLVGRWHRGHLCIVMVVVPGPAAGLRAPRLPAPCMEEKAVRL